MDGADDGATSLEVSRDFFMAVPNGEFTATLVALKKKVRQLVRFVNELGNEPSNKPAIDLLWRMLTFLAPYVNALDDPSGEMRVVVRDIKDSLAWAKRMASEAESRLRKQNVQRQPGPQRSSSLTLPSLNAGPRDMSAYFAKLEERERELARADFERRCRALQQARGVGAAPASSNGSSNSSSRRGSIVMDATGPVATRATRARSATLSSAPVLPLALPLHSLGSGVLAPRRMSDTSSLSAGMGPRSLPVGSGGGRLLGNHRTPSTKLRCLVDGVPTAFDFGRAGLDELHAVFASHVKAGTPLSLAPVATSQRFHFKVMAHRTQAGWATKQAMEFRFFDFAGKEVAVLTAQSCDDLLSPIMSPSTLSPATSPRLLQTKSGDTDEEEQSTSEMTLEEVRKQLPVKGNSPPRKALPAVDRTRVVRRESLADPVEDE